MRDDQGSGSFSSDAFAPVILKRFGIDWKGLHEAAEVSPATLHTATIRSALRQSVVNGVPSRVFLCSKSSFPISMTVKRC